MLNILDHVTLLFYEASAKKKPSKVDFAIQFSKSRAILKCGDAIVELKHESNLKEVLYIPYDL